ncbi:NUDIX hydrolase [Auraticoccus monumenti]|uniref:8-oxo-dGTP diphosphatase n=1 Tax=Auraticoccus monumenti TaxID=675864 RepID=A0A1G7AGD8_9ACTN|nr:NUDIX domain-containing protein [Auraticoccus monumenti]SDE13859.1 8-oxo-dGTP diphosphatase [Auraticoccus monumenti]
MTARPNAALTVDLVVLTVRADELQVLLVRRGIPPFEGAWALPGGFVGAEETLLAAAGRELEEETGFGPEQVHVEQVGTYGDPGRDPRGRVVTVVHLALLPDPGVPRAGTDAAEADWRPVRGVESGAVPLAFDHARLLADALERARAKLEYSPLATAFCPPEFTVADLRRVYETVWGVPLDPRNFHRKVTAAPGFVEATGRTRTERGRPAQLFRRGDARVLHPPLVRERPAAGGDGG